MNQDHFVEIGTRHVWGGEYPFGLSRIDRRQHAYVMANCLAGLLECQNTSILGVQRLLTDPLYREWVLKQVEDPAVRSFWVKEFASMDKRFVSEVIAPIQNKVGQLLLAAPLRNV